jgi:hypothetical protein
MSVIWSMRGRQVTFHHARTCIDGLSVAGETKAPHIKQTQNIPAEAEKQREPLMELYPKRPPWWWGCPANPT